MHGRTLEGRSRFSALLIPMLAVSAACTAQVAVDGDAPGDAGTDAGTTGGDAGSHGDTGPDAALDGALDAPQDAAHDAALDAAGDAAIDAAHDAALDASHDADASGGPTEAGVDAAPDTGSDASALSSWPPPLPANSVDYYVTTTGSDSGSGSAASPWRTIAHAASAISAGSKPVTVHVAPGNYVLDASSCISSSKNGTAAAPVTYVSDVRGGAKIDGHAACTIIWTQKGDYTNIWGFDFTGIKYAPSNCGGSGGSFVIESEATNGHVDLGYSVIHDLPWGFASAVDMDPWGNSTYTGAPMSVHDNVFHDIGNTTPGTGCGPANNYALYVASGPGTHVYNNLMYGIGTIGIHCWHAASGVYIYNNTIVGAETAILVGTGDGGATAGAYFEVVNNIVASSKYGVYAEANSPGSIAASSFFKDNLTYGNQIDWAFNNQGKSTTLQAAGMSVTGTIAANPLFQAPGSGDYHLAAGSPAIGAATPTGAPTHDLDGYPRIPGPNGQIDVGAYEHH